MTMEMMIGLVIFGIWMFCALSYIIQNFYKTEQFNFYEKLFVAPVMIPFKIIRFMIFGEQKNKK